jgi:ribosomal protein S18 acetylase RimI-like enzyme
MEAFAVELRFISVSSGDRDRLQQLQNLAQEIWQAYYPPLIGQAQVDYMLNQFQSLSAITLDIHQGMQYYLIQRGEMVLGYCALQPQGMHWYVSKLYILPQYHHQGIGSRAVNFMAKKALPLPLRLRVYKYNPALRFYQKQGFRVIGPVTTDIGNGFVMDDFVMERAAA